MLIVIFILLFGAAYHETLVALKVRLWPFGWLSVEINCSLELEI